MRQILKSALRFAFYALGGAVASAFPMQYQLAFTNATVHLGAQVYSNGNNLVVFTFTGDESDIFSGSVPGLFPSLPPVGYSAIHKGVASALVSSPVGVVLAYAVFATNQIVLTVDHQNDGVGFGFYPGGVGASGFDPNHLQPLYPAGVSGYSLLPGSTPVWWANYDLTLAYAQAMAGSNPGGPFHQDGSVYFVDGVYSCYQFDGSIFGVCNSTPAPIPTDHGAFLIDPISEPNTVGTSYITLTMGEFTAMPLPIPKPLLSLSLSNALGAKHPVLSLNGSPGGVYSIESASNCGTNAQWTARTAFVFTSSGPTWADPEPVSGAAAKYYRAAKLP